MKGRLPRLFFKHQREQPLQPNQTKTMKIIKQFLTEFFKCSSQKAIDRANVAAHANRVRLLNH